MILTGRSKFGLLYSSAFIEDGGAVKGAVVPMAQWGWLLHHCIEDQAAVSFSVGLGYGDPSPLLFPLAKSRLLGMKFAIAR